MQLISAIPSNWKNIIKQNNDIKELQGTIFKGTTLDTYNNTIDHNPTSQKYY